MALRTLLAGAALAASLTVGVADAASSNERLELGRAAQVARFEPSTRGDDGHGHGYVRPVTGGRITTPFGEAGPYWKSGFHPGLDIAIKTGTPILALADGVVVEAEFNAGYGNYVKLDHGDGLVTLYGHMSRIGVAVGDSVHAGDTIGLVGSTGVSTGPHLHLEVRQDGVRKDPMAFLPR